MSAITPASATNREIVGVVRSADAVRRAEAEPRIRKILRFAILLSAGADLAAATDKPCSLAGRVSDRTGAPVPSAVVSVLRQQLLSQTTVVASATTDSRGAYCLTDVAPGNYVVRAITHPYAVSASPDCRECCAPATAFAPALYRQPIHVDKASPQLGLDIRMHRVPVYCFAGEVRHHTGHLATDVSIALESDSWSTTVLSEGGRFLLTKLPAGSYSLVIADRPQLGRVLARKIIRVRGGNTGKVVIAIDGVQQSAPKR